jgi:hypothetical protein
MNLWTSEFDLRITEAKGNYDYQGHSGFYKLSNEGGNSEFCYQMNEAGRIEVESILEL